MYNISSNLLSMINSDGRADNMVLKATFNSTTVLDSEHLIDFTLDEMFDTSDGISMGATCSNKITINMFMPSNPIALRNGWVVPEVGFNINGTVQYIPLGKFYVTEIESKDDYRTVTITGYDGMCKLEEEYETGVTTWPASIQSVAQDIASQYGFTLASMTWPSITISEYIEGTCREYLGWIAGLLGKNARFDRDGKLQFKWYDTSVTNNSSTSEASVSGTVLTLNNATYSNGVLTVNNATYNNGVLTFNTSSSSSTGVMNISRSSQFLNGLERKETDLFTVNSITSGTEDNIIVAGNGVGISFENPFMTQTILNSIYSSVGQRSYYPCQISWKGNPALEVGDVVSVVDKNGNNLTVYVMEQSIKIGGGIKGEIFSYGPSETSISFSTDGPTGKEIKKLKQKYSDLQEAVANATNVINQTQGGIFKITDSDSDGINDGFLLAEHDGTLTSTTKCIVGNYQGIGFSTNGGATYTQAITHQGIVGSAIISGSITSEKLSITSIDELGNSIVGWAMEGSYLYNSSTVIKSSGDVAMALGMSNYTAGANTTGANARLYHNGKLELGYNGSGYNFVVNTDGSITANNLTLGNVSVPASSITGTIPTSQLSGNIDGSKISGSIDGSKIASVPVSKLSGNIPYSQISGVPDLTVYVTKGGAIQTIGSNPQQGSTGFKVSSSGLLTCSNAVVYGAIYASAGSIGSWRIGDLGDYTNSIFSTYCAGSSASSSNPEYAVFMRGQGSADTLAIGVKKRTSSSTAWTDAENTFYVKKDGTLKATTGNIGGIYIDSDRLICRNNNSDTSSATKYMAFMSYSYDSTNHNAIIIGTRESASDDYTTQFRVRYDGSVYMRNATITGSSSIAAACIPDLSASKITSGTISTDRLSTSVITTSNFSSKSLTTGNISVTNGGTIGSWTVDSSGNLRAGSGTSQVSLTSTGVSHGSGSSTSWRNIVMAGSNASDKRLKNDIFEFENKYDHIFDNLKPVRFRYNDKSFGEGLHFGFIAQDIIENMEENGVNDFSGVYKDKYNGEEYYQLQKQEFIALNTWQIQKLKQRVAELEAKLEGVK